MTAPAWRPAYDAVRRPRYARLDPITDGGLVAVLLVLFGMSGGLLWELGYNYDGLTGSALTKIHPATYLIVALFGWSILVSGDPVRRVVHLSRCRPASFLMAAIAMMILIIFVLRQLPGIAGVMDIYLGPALLVLLLADADERRMTRLETVLHCVMMLNALMGLYEFVTKNLFFPYRFDGMAFETDLRSAALQGHPLTNAFVTACYLMALLSGARSLSGRVRFLLIGVQSAALIVFGGRSAVLACLLFGGLYGLVSACRMLKSRRIPLLGAAFGIVLFLMLPIVITALWTSGFFDALISRFQEDGGSANARKEMFELVFALPFRELLVGPDVDWVDSMRRIQGLEWGIENPFVRVLIYQGLLIALLFTGMFSLYLYELARNCRPGVWLPMIVCIILLNAAETIGSKTTLPGKFALIVLCLYRIPKPAAMTGFRPAAWSGRGR